MAVAFAPNTDLSRDDLNIFLQNGSGNPANAYEITYAIYFVDPTPPESEVLIGSATRTPENPTVGEYYASFRVPSGATPGDYRIRWTFRELAGSPQQVVVQEFAVVASSALTASTYTTEEQDLIRRLRIWLRDNCLDGDETITIRVGIKEQHITLAELWEKLQPKAPASKLRTAFGKGLVQTLSLSPEGKWKWRTIEAVNRIEAPLERMVQVQTDKGVARMTAGHRVFLSPTEKLEAKDLLPHQPVAGGRDIQGVYDIGTADVVYDITVADYHNFKLDRSGLVVSNCPDRNYRFQPPEHEGTIGSYNQVFGYIWEDAELHEYLRSALDYFNLFPPETEDLTTITDLVNRKRVWTSAVLYGAVSLAAMALMANWTVNGFSVAGAEGVSVRVAPGQQHSIKLESLWDTLHNDQSVSDLRDSLLAGTLEVETVDPTTGQVSWRPVSCVLRHHVADQRMYTVSTISGRDVTLTGDHGLFVPWGDGVAAVRAEDLRSGQDIVIVDGGRWHADKVKDVIQAPSQEYAYDLSVPGPENFVLSSGILAHNSYSIGGISLDLNKASEYQSLKDTADQMFDKATTAKQQTVFIIRGLKQPRFAAGISTVGPNMNKGITMHPRNFMGA